jgi:hypothetical protein
MVRVGVIREPNGNQHATYVIQLVIFVLEVSLAPSQQTFTGLVQVGLYRLPNGDHTNVYGHVAVMHGHLCRTLCRVSAKGTRLADPFCVQPFLCSGFYATCIFCSLGLMPLTFVPRLMTPGSINWLFFVLGTYFNLW